MKKQPTVLHQNPEKAKRYVQLLNKGVEQIIATYKVFGTAIGDEMLRLKQHEVIIEPIINN